MTQRRHADYKDPRSSFDLDDRTQGILPSGRIRGFDTITGASGLTLSISHSATGSIQYDKDTHNASDPEGVWHTTQGIVVKENEDIGPFTFDTNAGNSEDRYDIIYGSHEYDSATTGGIAAVYGVIKGPLNDPSLPALTDDTRQVILSVIKIPAGASNLTDAIIIPPRVKGLADKEVAYLQETNIFEALQQGSITTKTITISTLDGPRGNQPYIVLEDKDPNFLYINAAASSEVKFMTAKNPGTLVVIEFGQESVAIKADDISAVEAGLGYAPFLPGLASDPHGAESFSNIKGVMGFIMSDKVGRYGKAWIPVFHSQSWDIAFAVYTDLLASLETKADIITLPVPWTVLTLQVSSNFGGTWANASGGTSLAYYKDSLGQVRLRGEITCPASTATTSPDLVATLPVGYRPSKRVYLNMQQVVAGSFAPYGSAGEAHFYVEPNGNIYYQSVGGPSTFAISSTNSFIAEA